MTFIIIVTLIISYLLGSIPSSVWIGKAFYKTDVREHGSGNAGATNTFRVLGKTPGLVVLFFDFLKGFVATSLPLWFFNWVEPNTNQMINWQIAHGACAVLGHIYPVFAGFKGGKGIATLLGFITSLSPTMAIICIVIFVVTVYITKYIAIGSMLATACSAGVAFYLYGTNKLSLIYFCMVTAVLVVYTHRTNIKRLKDGTESKFTFKEKPLVNN